MDDQRDDSTRSGASWDQVASAETDSTANPTDAAPDDGGRPRSAAGREMLVQLQQMIDTLATQAGPVMRDVAAKAAELAAIAGEKAGPIAHKAAGVTEAVGQRVAARSKEMAADLRRPRGTGLDVEEDIAASSEWGTDSGEPSTSPDETTSQSSRAPGA